VNVDSVKLTVDHTAASGGDSAVSATTDDEYSDSTSGASTSSIFTGGETDRTLTGFYRMTLAVAHGATIAAATLTLNAAATISSGGTPRRIRVRRAPPDGTHERRSWDRLDTHHEPAAMGRLHVDDLTDPRCPG